MVPEDPNTSDVSASAPIVITPKDIKAGKDKSDIARKLPSRRGYVGYVKVVLIPALAVGFLLEWLLSSRNVAMASIGGVVGAVAIGMLISLARHKGWIKSTSGNHLQGTESDVGSATRPTIMPPIIIRPEEILPETSSEIETGSVITIQKSELEPEEGVPEAKPVCPYCGEELGDRPVRTCRFCKTPHHRECWQANGGCTTLGCRSAPVRTAF